MLVTRDEAKQLVRPVEHLLIASVMSGVSDYLSLLNHFPQPIDVRTIANLIYDFIKAHAKNNLTGVDDVALLSLKGGLFIVVIKDKLALRFKKLNNNKMPSNIPTDQTVDWMNQNIELLPSHTALIVGYEMDPLRTRVQEITVTCPNGDTNLWSFNLEGFGGAEILELPLTSPSIPEIPMKVKHKTEKKEKRSSNE